MITKEQLIAAGYKPFMQRNIKEYTESFYQKRFDDDKGKKYFITIAEYDFISYPQVPYDFIYQPEGQFTSNGVTFDVTMLGPETVEQMEQFFEKMWYNLGCDYYEEWG